jgi:hypothetical protein
VSDVLGRMVLRGRGVLPAAEPLIPPRYAAAWSAPGLGERATPPGLAGEADLASSQAPEAGPDTRAWPAGAGGRRAGTDPGAGGLPLAEGRGSRDGPPGASGLVRTGLPLEVPGTRAPAGSTPAAPGRLASPSIQPGPWDLRGPGGSPAGPAWRGEPREAASPAGSGGPALPGTELPATWARPHEHSATSPMGQRSWVPGGPADGDGEMPGARRPAGPRSAHRAASRLGRDEGAPLEPYPGAPADDAAHAPPALTITIGHIEVRAAAEGRSRPQQARPEPPRRQPFRPQVTLAEFLARTEPGQVQGRRR